MTSKRFLLLAIVVAAAVVRMWDVDGRGVGHIEMYTPNIPLPAEISDPPPRLTLQTTLTGSFWEPHPPGWYLMNWPWTKVFGVSPMALRLPSVIAGTIGVFLIWCFAARERSSRVAAIAASLVAVNGLFVMWSQLSRPVIVVAVIGIASSLALLRCVMGAGRRDLVWYLGLTLLGVATDHYYWFLLGGQAVWVFMQSGSHTAFRDLMRWQFLAMAAASPLITLAVSQSRESYLGANLLETAMDYAAFGFLFGRLESTYSPPAWMPVVAVAIGILFLASGLLRRRQAATARFAIVTPSRAARWLVLLGSTVAVCGTALVLGHAGLDSTTRLLATAVVPVFFLAASLIAELVPDRWRMWPSVHLSTVLCSVPVLVVFLISFVMPFVDTKYFLLFTPFLFVVMAAGAVKLFDSRPTGSEGPASIPMRAAGVATVGMLAVLHAASLAQYRSVDSTPIDFRDLAAKIRPEAQDADQFVTYKHYAMTPIFYYLGSERSKYIDANRIEITQVADGRFWVVSLRDTGIDDPVNLTQALRSCTLASNLLARRIRAELYIGCRAVER